MGSTGTGSRWVCITLLVSFPSGCGPDLLERAELEEICGEPAPVRLLELPDEAVAYAGQAFRVGGRRLLSVRYAEEPSEGLPVVRRSENWSVGECGESPRLMSDHDYLWSYAVWPEVPLGCTPEVGEVTTLDLEGTRPSNVVLRLPECIGLETPHGLVTVEPHDEDLGALVLQPWPDDPWTQTASPQVLLDPIRIRAAESSHTWPAFHEVLSVLEDELLAITPNDELVSLSLLDGTLAVEATHVREFERSPDGRWLVWQDLEVTNDDEAWPAGAVFVRDRESGTSTFLADTMLAATLPSALTFIDAGVIRLRMGYVNRDPERYWLLPSMLTVDLPAPRTAEHRLDDGRYLVSSFFGGPYELFDPGTAELRALFGHDGTARVREDGTGIDVIQNVECCISQGFGEVEGKLWAVDWDGERQLLAPRVTSPYFTFPDDRLLTTVGVGEDRVGSMIVVDPRTLDEQLVDDHVLTGGKQVENDDEIVYVVTDGERSGVWLTKLAR